jgi:quercetin dioxygenase-like cupin family protein
VLPAAFVADATTMRRFCLLLLLFVGIDVVPLHPGGQQAAAGAVSFWRGSETFAGSSLLVDRMGTNHYQVYAVRRDRPTAVELHAVDTDIVIVLDGSGMFVTGGSVVDGRDLGPDEQTGTRIRGGDARQLAQGDVIVVPNGTPYWLRDVNGAIRYLVVKIRQATPHPPAPAAVRFWKGADAFATGGLVFEAREGRFARVYALRRNQPLGVELHGVDTDIVFVTGGSGTFVTEGRIVEPRPLRENEGTGTSITDGTSRSLDKGALLVIPSGVPHWLRDINGSVEFLAVKVR